MNWDQILTQAGLLFLKEGLNFVFSAFKDNKKAEDAQKVSEGEAQALAQKVIEKETELTSALIQPNINWEKVGTLFWLGNDLMWIQDMMYRGAMPERVLQGVHIVKQYFEDMSFDKKSFPAQQLAISQTILESLQGISDPTLDNLRLIQQHYKSVNQYITTLKWYVNALVEQQQSGFKKRKAF